MNAIVKTTTLPSCARRLSIEKLVQFANMASKSAMVLRLPDKPGRHHVGDTNGIKIGLAPMQSLQNIACVNGRPAVWGERGCRSLPPVARVQGHRGGGDRPGQTGRRILATRVGAEPVDALILGRGRQESRAMGATRAVAAIPETDVADARAASRSRRLPGRFCAASSPPRLSRHPRPRPAVPRPTLDTPPRLFRALGISQTA